MSVSALIFVIFCYWYYILIRYWNLIIDRGWDAMKGWQSNLLHYTFWLLYSTYLFFLPTADPLGPCGPAGQRPWRPGWSQQAARPPSLTHIAGTPTAQKLLLKCSMSWRRSLPSQPAASQTPSHRRPSPPHTGPGISTSPNLSWHCRRRSWARVYGCWNLQLLWS